MNFGRTGKPKGNNNITLFVYYRHLPFVAGMPEASWQVGKCFSGYQHRLTLSVVTVCKLASLRIRVIGIVLNMKVKPGHRDVSVMAGSMLSTRRHQRGEWPGSEAETTHIAADICERTKPSIDAVS